MGNVPGSAEMLAGDDLPLRHRVESPMFTIFFFFAIPRSECSSLASATLVSGTSGSRSGLSSSASFVSRSAQTVSFPSPSSRNIQAVPSCVETLQRFARLQGFSSNVAKEIAFAHRPSSRAGYQAKWSVFQN